MDKLPGCVVSFDDFVVDVGIVVVVVEMCVVVIAVDVVVTGCSDVLCVDGEA